MKHETIEDYWLLKQSLRVCLKHYRAQQQPTLTTQNYDMGSETTYFTIDDDGNNQILGYANLMSMGVEEDHLEGFLGGDGGEDPCKAQSMKHGEGGGR